MVHTCRAARFVLPLRSLWSQKDKGLLLQLLGMQRAAPVPKAHRGTRSVPLLGARDVSAQVPPTRMATDLDARGTNSEALTCNLVSHELAGFDLANAPKETPELLLGHVLG